MNTTLFYYTGTGNSLWVARTLAESLGNAELVSISKWMKAKGPFDCEIAGIVFPVHAWGVPHPIIKFIAELKPQSARYLFAVAVNAGQVAYTLVQLENLLGKNGITLCSGYDISLPSNYIPWGGAEPKEKQEQKFAAAKNKITKIVSAIENEEYKPVERGPLWQRYVFSPLYKLSFLQMPRLDRNFWVDEKCNQCGTCARVCPADNIHIIEGRPTWNHRCEQCLACIQWCPQKAIQYGKKTPKYERYHQPEIQLQDMLD